MKLKDKMRELTRARCGLLATNYYNLETLHGVLKAAALSQQPVILQLTRSSIEYMGLDTAVQLGRAGLKAYNVEGWIHLDHGDSLELVQRCLDAGFDSVMIDGSELPFEENIRLTSQVVKQAASYNANVEAELGYVAKLGQPQHEAGLTQVAEAVTFSEETGIDALAVAIGTAHGFYKSEPKLQFELLSALRESLDVVLVLHGGSGVPAEQLREAIQRGICKINLATEIKNIFMKTLQQLLIANEEIDLRKVFPKATAQVTELVAGKLQIVGNLDTAQ